MQLPSEDTGVACHSYQVKCRLLGMNAKINLYEGVVVRTTLYGAEIGNMRAADRRFKQWKTCMDQMRNERQRTGTV